ncbi:glycosyltransferase [Micromonospora sp. NPDC092111]|uniref:glycosyltransferase n=1 Tax=Micromonospora sp. NPDC092111 TaxID=3364289 RepID=UPI003800F199
MKASLVIPTYNSRHLLEACLISLNHQSIAAGDSFEVLLVDDGSTDGTGEMVQKLEIDYDLRYLFKPRTPESCRSATRNLGIGKAEGEVVVMVDGDQVLAPDFVAEHLRAHRDRTDLVVIGDRVYLEPGVVDLDALRRGFSLDAVPPVADRDERETILEKFSHNLHNLATRWHFLYGCNVSVRREHLLAVGGFDEAFKRWSFEDVELGYRLHLRGLVFVHHPYAILYHQHHGHSAVRQHADWRENFAHFTAKHRQPEVACQWILDRFFNPEDNELTWTELYLRLEYAVRALQGRLPMTGPVQVLQVTDDPRGALRAITERAQEGHLLVVDRTDDRDLPLLVQAVPSPHELFYFKEADPIAAAALIDQYTA